MQRNLRFSSLSRVLLALVLTLLLGLGGCVGVYSPDQLEPRHEHVPSRLLAEVLMHLEADYYRWPNLKPDQLLQGAFKQVAEDLPELRWTLVEAGRTRVLQDAEGATLLTSGRLQSLEDLNDFLQEAVGRYQQAAPDSEPLELALATGLTSALDPHTVVFAPNEFEAFRNSVIGRYAGVGILVREEDGRLLVVDIFPDSPAEKAGVQADDRILRVDGEAVTAETVERILEELKGEPGTLLTLTLEREGREKALVLQLRRELVQADSLQMSALQTATGTVQFAHLDTFQQGSAQELVRKLGDLEGSEAVILDLRDNPGGLLETAVEISDLFLPRDQLIVEASTTISSQQHRSQSLFLPERWNTVPVVVLVNRNSASASEILASALQQHQRALVLGEKTYGKGTIQSAWETESGAGVKVTIGEYRLPDGTSLHEKGLLPDVLVKEELDPEADTVPPLEQQPSVQEALTLLQAYTSQGEPWPAFVHRRSRFKDTTL